MRRIFQIQFLLAALIIFLLFQFVQGAVDFSSSTLEEQIEVLVEDHVISKSEVYELLNLDENSIYFDSEKIAQLANKLKVYPGIRGISLKEINGKPTIIVRTRKNAVVTEEVDRSEAERVTHYFLRDWDGTKRNEYPTIPHAVQVPRISCDSQTLIPCEDLYHSDWKRIFLPLEKIADDYPDFFRELEQIRIFPESNQILVRWKKSKAWFLLSENLFLTECRKAYILDKDEKLLPLLKEFPENSIIDVRYHDIIIKPNHYPMKSE